jgi:4-carboxymuconolactone decarboxylase
MSFQKDALRQLYKTILGSNDEEFLKHVEGTFLRDGLHLRKRLLCVISTLASTGHTRQLSFFIEWAFMEEIDALEINEVILQTYLFAGYPAAIEGFFVLRDVLQRRGLSCDTTEVEYSVDEWRERGIELCKKIYGKNFEQLQENMRELSSELAEWMLVEGYGKVLSRTQLGVVERELCTVAALTAMGKERQLHSHVKGALHVGATVDEVREAIFQTALFAGQPAAQKGLEILRHVNVRTGLKKGPHSL